MTWQPEDEHGQWPARKASKTMASEKMDLLTGREYEANGETKTAWTKCGVMFPSKDGEGWSIMLDALPVNGKMIARKPLPPRDGDAPQQRGGGNRGRGSDSGDMPF